MQRLLLVVPPAVLGACTSAPVATPTGSIEPADTVAPLQVPVPSAQAAGPSWWAWPGVTTCGLAAEYRVGLHVFGLGGCLEVLVDPDPTATLHVGEQIDIHVTTNAPVGTAPPKLIYPLPSLSSSDVLELIATSDSGATASYRAVGLGKVKLTTSGLCSAGGDETRGSCPLLTVNVVAG